MAGANNPMAYLQNNPYLGRFRALMQYAQTGVMPLPTASQTMAGGPQPVREPAMGLGSPGMFPGGGQAGGPPKTASFFPSMTPPPVSMSQYRGLMPADNWASSKPVMSMATPGQAPMQPAGGADLINKSPGPEAAQMYKPPTPKVYTTNAPGKGM